MTNKELDKLIISVLSVNKNTSLPTYVVANKINQLLYDRKEVSRVNTNSVRARLKKLEKIYGWKCTYIIQASIKLGFKR